MTGQEEPWHRILVDPEHGEELGDLYQGEVGPHAVIQMILTKAGTEPLPDDAPEDAEPRHRLPALKQLQQSLLRLSQGVNAARAELIAETMGRDPYKPDPSSEEWDPDNPEDRRREGLPRRGDR